MTTAGRPQGNSALAPDPTIGLSLLIDRSIISVGFDRCTSEGILTIQSEGALPAASQAQWPYAPR